MFEQYLQNLNIPALLVSALAYFSLGSVWFSGLFGKAWMAELEKQGKTIEKPGQKEMLGMMIGSFIYNLLTVFAVSYVIFISQTTTLPAALKMGALLGSCIAWTAIGTTYTWEKRSFRHLAIDGGYHFCGVMIAALVMTLWH